MSVENPSFENEPEPEIKILPEDKPENDINVQILSEEFYEEREKEIGDTIDRVFGSQDIFIENLRSYNQKLSEENPKFSLKEKLAHLLADESAENQKERRDSDIDKKVKIVKPRKAKN